MPSQKRVEASALRVMCICYCDVCVCVRFKYMYVGGVVCVWEYVRDEDFKCKTIYMRVAASL